MKLIASEKKVVGAIVGDYVGSCFEGHNVKTKNFEFFGPYSHKTDDSAMTVAIFEALTNSKEDYSDLEEQTVKSMRKFGELYPRGFGSGFRKWLQSPNPQPYNSWGNGSAMRVSGCGWVASSIEEAEQLAEKTAKVTHNHPEGIKGAKATAVAIFLARKGRKKEDIEEYINENYYKIDFTLDEIRDTYHFDVSCQGSVPQALQSFFESTCFEDCLRNAISIGGDSDTIAAIACSVAGAYYGVPQYIIDYIDFDILQLRTIQNFIELLNNREPLEQERRQVLGVKFDSEYNLERFVLAQTLCYEEAIKEIMNGRKESHWMWYIFPQMKGLGFSGQSQYFGITCKEEALDYLKHPVLSKRLVKITKCLLKHDSLSIEDIFGDIDALKLRSCMTLFNDVSPNDVFKDVLDRFYNGEKDNKTLELMEENFVLNKK